MYSLVLPVPPDIGYRQFDVQISRVLMIRAMLLAGFETLGKYERPLVRSWLKAAEKMTCAATLYVVGVCINRIGAGHSLGPLVKDSRHVSRFSRIEKKLADQMVGGVMRIQPRNP